MPSVIIDLRADTQAEPEIAREAIDILGRLVSFDTTSSESNLALIAYVETYLAEHGVTSRLVCVGRSGAAARISAGLLGPLH